LRIPRLSPEGQEPSYAPTISPAQVGQGHSLQPVPTITTTQTLPDQNQKGE
jgi:hypothetical protein